MTIALPALPYDYHALEPVISSTTMKVHHGAHHGGYVQRLNALIKDSEFEGKPLDEIVRRAGGVVFNNAAQAWNHAFFWKSLRPKPSNPQPRSALAARFSDALKSAAAGLFGSGWVWLVEDDDILKVVTTPNADTPIAIGQKPLLVIDLWEHGYYLDHQNRRDRYVSGVIDHLLDWEFAERNLLNGESTHVY